jgi:hypothetical protein
LLSRKYELTISASQASVPWRIASASVVVSRLVGLQRAAQDILAHPAQHVEGRRVLGKHVLRRRRDGGTVGAVERHLQDLGHGFSPQTPR